RAHDIHAPEAGEGAASRQSGPAGRGQDRGGFSGRARGRDEEPHAAPDLDGVRGRTQCRHPRRHGRGHPDARAWVLRIRVLDSQPRWRSARDEGHAASAAGHPWGGSPCRGRARDRCDHKLTDYDFQLSQPLTAGKHVVRVENTGAQAHEIVIAALSAGKTLQDFITWEAGGEKGPLPTGEWLGGVTTLDVGGHSQFAATFAPGSYLLLCFWPDAKDGKPHIMHGMAKQITIS